jgi:hypothetical protein
MPALRHLDDTAAHLPQHQARRAHQLSVNLVVLNNQA